ncbi:MULTISPECIES: glycoside-pentoside-hexuronide (GPH):cation symporter [unclassified Facklamia]|uniref:MFS transporter n=1 Tax=Aerococcaceae TaxID=186827 RepID=UPI0013B87612|nr:MULTISPECIES: glycoside-pentoside-hexuronide (GPH):cation symporter [unclassified Facklamia]NEW65099.1 MFS transporter [Facklamia sp. 252]NEW68703.1 MFS transporter [Facklamia sp. 253]QQD65496.1 MFS transporter [Aerococcaceae bacterium zg-252]
MKEFGVKDQVGYVFGDLAGSMVTTYVGMFFLTFCTYVLGLSPQYMAGLFLFAKFWDAVNDPLIGSIPDRYMIGKSGDRFKPYIKLAMGPLALSVLICFANVSGWAMTAKQIWVAFAYLIYDLSYTGTSMPYGAMASVITDNPEERMKLSRARSFGGIAVGLFFMPIINMLVWNSDRTPNVKNYFLVAIFAALGSLLFYTIMLATSTERIKTTNIEKEKISDDYSFREVMKDALHNRPLLGIMLTTIGGLIGASAAGTLSMYLYREYYQNPRIMSMSSIISLPITLICFFAVPKLAKKYGKKNVVIGGLCYNLIFSLCLYIFPIGNPMTYLILSNISSAGALVFMILTWAFVTDIIDYQEYKTGRRADGTLYSIYTFSRKVGSSLSSTLMTFLLGVIGFVSGVQEQAPGVGEGIRTLVTLAPVLACIVQLIGMGLVYNLSREKTEAIQEELTNRKAGREVM